MNNTNKILTIAALVSSALFVNGCVVNPGAAPRGNNPYQSAQNGYNTGYNNPNNGGNGGGYNGYNNNGGYNNQNNNGGGVGAAGLQDLLGAKGGSGESQLENRGYSYVKGEKGGGSSYTAWRRGNECVWVRAQNGRYVSIADASPADCAGGGPSGVRAAAPSGGGGLPFFNATCPGGIDIHADEGGSVYFNGQAGNLRKINPNYFKADGAGITLSIAVNPNGPPTLSYTGKHGANGVCQLTGN